MFAKKYVDVIEEKSNGNNQQPRETWIVRKKMSVWLFDLLMYIKNCCKEEGNNSFSMPRAQVVMVLSCNSASL